jgi:hypothetical protein
MSTSTRWLVWGSFLVDILRIMWSSYRIVLEAVFYDFDNNYGGYFETFTGNNMIILMSLISLPIIWISTYFFVETS